MHMESWFAKLAAVLALAVVVLVLAAPRGRAADLGKYGADAPVVASPLASWTGVYLGAGVGVTAGRSAEDVWLAEDGERLGAIGADTAVTGVHGVLSAGADYMPSGSRWLVGVYGQYALGDADGDVARLSLGSDSFALQSTLSNQWSVGARAGALITAGSLLYVKAGYAAADVSIEAPGLEWSDSVTGWEVGGGLETALGAGFFLRGEYTFTDYGAFETGASLGGYDLGASVDHDAHRFTAQLVYKLGR